MWRSIPRCTRSTKSKQKKPPDDSGFVRGAFYLCKVYQWKSLTISPGEDLVCDCWQVVDAMI
jgi:hypothetical protein